MCFGTDRRRQRPTSVCPKIRWLSGVTRGPKVPRPRERKQPPTLTYYHDPDARALRLRARFSQAGGPAFFARPSPIRINKSPRVLQDTAPPLEFALSFFISLPDGRALIRILTNFPSEDPLYNYWSPAIVVVLYGRHGIANCCR